MEHMHTSILENDRQAKGSAQKLERKHTCNTAPKTQPQNEIYSWFKHVAFTNNKKTHMT